MAKVSKKSEKITAFGGIFFVLDKFDRILSSVIDSHLGLRSKLIGYQYSEIIRAIFSVFCCGGDCMEDLNLYLKDVLTERPHTRVPSADTVLRGYKGFDGYSPGVFTIGGLIVYLENRDGNANVRFMQAETHRRFFEMMRSFGIHVRSFRADCGSYSEDIVKMVMEHTDKFYIRAERYAGLYEKVKRQTGWTTVEIGFQQYDVQSFPFESFEDVKHCRLVVQRQRKQKGEQLDIFDGEYTYRCILTNDWDMTDEEIIQHYNKRGTAEQVFDRQNNDFGWAHLPKSFMNQNTVFLLLTAMAANFYQYIVSLPLMCLFGVEATDRVKSFLFRFIAVPAKWIRTARQYKLNIYSNKPYKLIWEHG